VHSDAETDHVAHPVAARAVDLDAVDCRAAAPALHRCSANAERIPANWSEFSDDTFDDDLIMVIAVAGQNDAAVEALVFAHVQPRFAVRACEPDCGELHQARCLFA
jgi:hypothetical protein